MTQSVTAYRLRLSGRVTGSDAQQDERRTLVVGRENFQARVRPEPLARDRVQLETRGREATGRVEPAAAVG